MLYSSSPFTRIARLLETGYAMLTISIWMEINMASLDATLFPLSSPPSRLKNIVGYRSVKLVVLSVSRREGVTYAFCQCDCGNTCEVRAGNISGTKGQPTQSCGCAKTIDRRKDYTGQRFGRLVVQEMCFLEGQTTCAKAQCDCGASWYGDMNKLVSGNTSSCGGCPKISPRRRDLVGQTFGKLLIVQQEYRDGGAWLHATCACGGTWQGEAYKATSGHTQSCGCIKAAQTIRPLYKREWTRLGGHRRRARERQLPSDFTKDDLTFLFQYWNFACAICGNEDGGLFHFLSLDHWIPLNNPASPGTVAGNILPLCHWRKGTKNISSIHAPFCNASKHDKDPVAWLTAKLGPRKANAKLRQITAYFALVKERGAACIAS